MGGSPCHGPPCVREDNLIQDTHVIGELDGDFLVLLNDINAVLVLERFGNIGQSHNRFNQIP